MFLFRHISFLFILFQFLIIFSGCTEKDRTIYYPLAKKMQWQYLATMVYVRRSIDSKLILENLGGKIIDGETVFTKLHHNGHRSYFFQMDEAILQNSQKPTLEGVDSSKESHFVLPIEMKEGDEWGLHSRPYVMERAIEYEVALQTSTPAVKLSKPLYMNYKLVSLNEEVRVRAGTYRQCAKIVGEGSCEMSANGGNFSGSIIVNVNQTDWYCPNVGLTKSIRSENSPSNLFDPVTYRQELEKITSK
jgi:hypothetical protein